MVLFNSYESSVEETLFNKVKDFKTCKNYKCIFITESHLWA